MSQITRILEAIEAGEPRAPRELLPLVYEELRRLAAAKLAHEKPGQTLEPTALVHEAYLRLVASPGPESGEQSKFANRRHFFAAAAEAMRRILIESARRKKRIRHGGELERVPLPEDVVASDKECNDLLAIHEALDRLAEADATAAELVKLHYFAGVTIEQAAEILGLSSRTAYRTWSFARAWLYRCLGGNQTQV